jgi:hypothetical protein
MADDRSYIDPNTRERDRMRALVEGLDDDGLTAHVNEFWTVAGVLGHIAYWDIRVLCSSRRSSAANRGRRGMPSPMATGSTIQPAR